MAAFFIRVAAEADRHARALGRHADTATSLGLPALAKQLRDVASVLARLAFDAARDRLGDEPFVRVADDCHVAWKGALSCSGQFRDVMYVGEAREVERIAMVLKGLQRDTMAETQPITVKPKDPP
jgi:hypothetical protein